ncbi:MAG TPA: hypothetical protein H9869_06520 [Candidatus Ligilactobacillus excrementipullorum]|nr:hypothetical protein [Candidatus Ligilactobacillus excrementipullorum]
MKVKARKQENAIILTIPTEFHVQAGQEFEIKQLANGIIRLTPIVPEKYPAIWEDDPVEMSRFNAELGSADDGRNFGRENVDY